MATVLSGGWETGDEGWISVSYVASGAANRPMRSTAAKRSGAYGFDLNLDRFNKGRVILLQLPEDFVPGTPYRLTAWMHMNNPANYGYLQSNIYGSVTFDTSGENTRLSMWGTGPNAGSLSWAPATSGWKLLDRESVFDLGASTMAPPYYLAFEALSVPSTSSQFYVDDWMLSYGQSTSTYAKDGDVWKPADKYAKENGIWKPAATKVRHNNIWKDV